MSKKWKGSFLFALVLLINMLFVACGSDSKEKNTFFVGLIDEVNDSTILVKVMEALRLPKRSVLMEAFEVI